MNSKSIASSGTFVTNPLYRSVGAGDAKKGPPQTLQKPLDVNDFVYSGEPQELSDLSNLSLHDATSQTKSAPSQQRFSSHAPLDDGSRIADSANEDDPEPAPLPAQTPPGSGQAVMQLSDDPAVAALQKSQVAMTCLLVTYAQCLSILDSALANPECKLPANSFSYLRGLFTGLVQKGEARALELKTETEQLLTQHCRGAKALAAHAENAGSPVIQDTFSTRSSQVVTEADLDRALDEMKQLPQPAQRDQVAQGLRLALADIGTVTTEDLDSALRQMAWDLDNPGLEGVDPELGAFHKQLQLEEAEPANQKSGSPTPLSGNTTAPKKTVPSAEFFDELDELFEHMPNSPARTEEEFATPSNTTNPSTSADSTKKQGLGLDAELLALLDDLENTPPPSPTPSIGKNAEQPIKLSDDTRQAIDHEAVRHIHATSEALNKAIERIEKRKLTHKEEKHPEFRLKETRRLTISVIADYYRKQQQALNLANRELAAIEANEILADAFPSERMKRVAELQAKRQASLQLIDSMALRIHHLGV